MLQSGAKGKSLLRCERQIIHKGRTGNAETQLAVVSSQLSVEEHKKARRRSDSRTRDRGAEIGSCFRDSGAEIGSRTRDSGAKNPGKDILK